MAEKPSKEVRVLQQPHQLLAILEPVVRSELLEAIPALARTMRHAAATSALVGMGYNPAIAYLTTEQWKQLGLIPFFGPESQILFAYLGPTALQPLTPPLTGGGIVGAPLWAPGITGAPWMGPGIAAAPWAPWAAMNPPAPHETY